MTDETPTAPEPIVGAGTGTLPDDPATHPEAALSPWPPPTRSGAEGNGRGGLRNTLTAAIAGGLVGALAAGAVFLLADDNGTQVVQSNAVKPVITRDAKQLPNGNVAAIIADAEPAVVAITVGDGPGTGNGGAGTGFVISSDGYIVTNNHVVENETRIEVAFTDGHTLPADIVGTDPSVDLALLKVDEDGLPALELGDSDAAQVGDDVLAIGNALALEGGLSVTEGIISGTNRTITPDTGAALVGMLQTDAAINPGNSGGPLLDADGRVIGVNTAIDVRGQNIGFAIPTSRAKPVLADLRAHRKPAFLGVSPQTVTPAVARELRLSVESGAYVAEVTDGAPAQDAGIRVGDVIIQIGNREIASDADVFTAVREHRPGQTVDVVVVRGDEKRTFQVRLTTRPDAQ